MAKPEWGQKRTCSGCGTRFYDLMRDPITCPSCNATVDPTAFSRTRRSRTVTAKVEAVPAAAPEPEKLDAAIEDDEDLDVGVVGDDDDDDDDLIEDASELGEDDDDVSEVVEGVDDNEPE